jgi:ubiquinone/menaquinone biosynthesis C-methylase UbiE
MYYDAIYRSQGKDYAAEARRIHELIGQFKRSPGNRLLDVACGTGGHLEHWRTQYDVEGLDLEEGMVAYARRRYPQIPIHQASMIDFVLPDRFDAITCLFSAIGYVLTVENLGCTLANLARHLQPGGVLLVEPWLDPEQYRVGSLHSTFVDEPELRLARMVLSEREDNLSILNFHYLIATPAGVEHLTERHVIAMFTHEEYMAAFRRAGLDTYHDPEGITGRGLYIGVRPV